VQNVLEGEQVQEVQKTDMRASPAETTGLAGTLRDRILDKSARVGVIGLGYVGLPVACEFARVGFAVTGIDVKSERIAMIAAGRSPIEGDEPGLDVLLSEVIASTRLRASTDYALLADADVITINVDTPVDDSDHKPRYVALRGACKALGAVLKRGALVIVESTVAPGTVDRVVRPELEAASGMTANTDFFLGACPERVMPGRLLANLRNIGRVCGGSTPEIAETMALLYRQVVNALVDTTDVVTAELVKTTENAYRDVQIAFANEVALICESVGADVYKVRELVNKVPQRNMHVPGAGVGGHCIPKDPWLLASAAGDARIRLIPAARAINEDMPLHIGRLLKTALDAKPRGTPASAPRVAVLGYAYLENSDDSRHSPSEALITQLRTEGYDVVVHDPWVEAYKGDVYARVAGCDAAILMVGHDVYRQLDFDALGRQMSHRFLINGRPQSLPITAPGFDVVSVGIG
jgi:UDP-N-acetyl-D-mannosaminuronic acid dehydrogenase